MSLSIDYSILSTFNLIERISVHDDDTALNYFLTTRKLLVFNKQRLLLPEYLQLLRERNYAPFIFTIKNEKKLDEKLDFTYDRTLQKFSVLKIHSDKIDGPYCDNQYKELHKQILNELRYLDDEIHVELEIESRFKKMVIRHLKYSWLEICRMTNILYKRYRWDIGIGTIELMRPLRINGREFTKWLNEHIENPSPYIDGEKNKIQKEIDDWFGKSMEIDYSKIDYSQSTEFNPDVELDRYPEDFPTLIANEKAKNVSKLRPSIKLLGALKVKEFVKKILESILYEKNNDISIANEFGLSKATYSRFAGRDWKKENNGEVPDLWKNIANIVINNPIIAELAIDLGLKQIIDSTIISRSKR